MTTAAPTETEKAGGTYLDHWSLTTAITDGDPISIPGAPDRTVQVLGTFGGATCVIEGSLDGGTTYFGLHDHAGVALSFTAAGGAVIAENPTLIRARLSVAGTGAAVEVYISSRSAR